MNVLKFTFKLCAGAFLAGLFATGGAGTASAQTEARYLSVENQFGTTITLDLASCTNGFLTPPGSIANGVTTGAFSAKTSSSSTGCNVRYQTGIYGCQFQINASNSGGIVASASAYKSDGKRPLCRVVEQQGISGGYQARFRME